MQSSVQGYWLMSALNLHILPAGTKATPGEVESGLSSYHLERPFDWRREGKGC